MKSNFAKLLVCYVLARTLVLGYLKTNTASFIDYDPKLILFQNCLVKWRISDPTLSNGPLFVNLQTTIFNKTPNVLQTGKVLSLPNITMFDIANNLPQYTKYLNCQVLFNQVFPKQEESSVLDGDSEFIYFSEHHTLSTKEILVEPIRTVNFSGTPLFLNLDGRLELICFSNVKHFSAIPSSVNDKLPLKHLWKMLHRDLQGTTLTTVSNHDTDSTCPIHYDSFSCLVKSFFNATINLASVIKLDLTDFVDEGIVDTFVVNNFVWYGMSKRKYDLSVPGFKFKRYELIIALVKPRKYNMVALSQPFVLSVWLTLILALLVVSHILRNINGSVPANKHLRFLASISLTLFAFLGQYNKTVQNFFNAEKCRMLWMMWAFGLFMISRVYNGQSYSLLSGDYRNQYPKTLKEVAYQNVSVLTTGVSFQQHNLTYRMTQSILIEYIKDLNLTNPSLFPSYFAAVLKNVHFLYNAKQSWSLYVEEIFNFTKNHQKGMFAMLDEPKRLNEILPSIETTNGIKVVHKKPVENFVTYQTLLIRKNFLYSKLLHILWQSKESGLWDYWEWRKFLDSQISLFKEQGLKTENKSINLVGYLQKFKSKNIVAPNEGFHVIPIALSFKVLLNLNLLYAVLIVFASVVFGFEKWQLLLTAVIYPMKRGSVGQKKNSKKYQVNYLCFNRRYDTKGRWCYPCK